MVRVGPPPGLRQCEGRWGWPTSTWEATGYRWITTGRWGRVQDFQTRPTIWNATLSDASTVNHLAAEVDRKLRLNPERTTVWQLDLMDSEDYRAVFGEQRLVEWSWFDAHVRRPILVALAAALTRLRYNPEAA